MRKSGGQLKYDVLVCRAIAMRFEVVQWVTLPKAVA